MRQPCKLLRTHWSGLLRQRDLRLQVRGPQAVVPTLLHKGLLHQTHEEKCCLASGRVVLSLYPGRRYQQGVSNSWLHSAMLPRGSSRYRGVPRLPGMSAIYQLFSCAIVYRQLLAERNSFTITI